MSVEELFRGDGENATDLLAVVESLFDSEGINLKTVLNSKQVVRVAVALTFARTYDVDILPILIQSLLELKVSDKGVGRKDLRAVLASKLRRRDDESERLARRLGQ